MKRFQDKVALVTGGASGIGKATAKRFVMDGARVMIGDLNGDAGKIVAKELGESARFFKVDVGDPEQVAAMVNSAGLIFYAIMRAWMFLGERRMWIRQIGDVLST
jgi:NAD(P)-dependent dehydrogenase (short-subunit alcohol dehydrogenase family)